MNAPEVTKLAKELIKEITEYKHCYIYAVQFSTFSDPRKQVCLVEPDEIKDKFRGTITKNACFRGLERQLKDEKLNRVYMEIVDCQIASPKITSEEKKQWIELAQKYKFLPEYVEQSWTDGGKYVIDLNDKNMSPSLLYAYLTVIRYIREEPGFIKSILIMTNHGVNFYIAFVLSSKMYVTNVGHHIISSCKAYPYKEINTVDSVLNTELNIGAAIAIRRYFNNPRKYDTRNIINKNAVQKQWFSCITNIQATTGIKTNIKASNLLDPLVVKAVMSDNDKEAKKHLKKLL
jgi:hypothetical protein